HEVDATFEQRPDEHVAEHFAHGPGKQRRDGPTQHADNETFNNHHQPNNSWRCSDGAQHAHLATSFEHVQTHRRHQTKRADTAHNHRHDDQKDVDHQHVLIETEARLGLARTGPRAHALLFKITIEVLFDDADRVEVILGQRQSQTVDHAGLLALHEIEW